MVSPPRFATYSSVPSGEMAAAAGPDPVAIAEPPEDTLPSLLRLYLAMVLAPANVAYRWVPSGPGTSADGVCPERTGKPGSQPSEPSEPSPIAKRRLLALSPA
jgi:hypothetical protein